MSIANPEHYGYAPNHTSDNLVYTKKLGSGFLIIEIFKHFWVNYYSETGRLKSFVEKDCLPLSTLQLFLQKSHQVL